MLHAVHVFVQYFVVTYVHVHTKFAFITCTAIFLSRHIWSSVTALHALFSLSISTVYEGGKNFMSWKKKIDVDAISARFFGSGVQLTWEGNAFIEDGSERGNVLRQIIIISYRFSHPVRHFLMFAHAQ